VASSRDEVPERVSQRIDAEKCLILLLWSANGIQGLVEVPKGSTYNSAFFCGTVVTCLFDGITVTFPKKITQSLYIHLENARPHDARRSTECLHTEKIQWIRHPAHTLNLALGDFFLFVYIKRKLTEYDIPDRQSSKSTITHIFDEIRPETLEAVFETSTNRLDWVTEHKGEYFHH
jgi:hypothetical protein